MTNANQQMVKFSFHGDDLDVLPANGRVWVSVRRVCEALGVDVSGQLKKLKAKPWGSVEFISMQVDGDDQRRDIAMLDLDALPMWLATIEPSRVAEDVREKLVAYQREAARVLADHFLGKRGGAVAIPPEMTAAYEMVPALAAQLAELKALLTAGSVMTQQVAGRGGATVICGRLNEYARLMASDGSPEERRRWRGRGEMELRGHLAFVGTGRRWSVLPIGDFHKAQIKLEEMIRMARSNAVARGVPNGVEQAKLFGGGDGGKGEPTKH